MADLWTALPLWYIVLLFSMTCHEAAHALAAKWGGDHTAHAGGQVTIDPIPHIRREPFGMVVVPLVSYFLQGGQWMIGWASAPYDPNWANRHPKKAAAMAFCGPAANILIGLVAAGVLAAGLSRGWFVAGGAGRLPFWFEGEGAAPYVAAGLLLAVYLNLILAVLNLMPFPPFDGGALPGLFMTNEGRLSFQRLAREWSLLGLVGGWYLTGRVLDLIKNPMLEALLGVRITSSPL